ncbi:MAG TPA: hypothetical protein VGI95_16925 [Caulobacteraceae bacterium]|jgi:hypothetical protein
MIGSYRTSAARTLAALAALALGLASATATTASPGQLPGTALAHGYTCYPNGPTFSCFQPTARTARALRCYKGQYGDVKCYAPGDLVGSGSNCFVTGDHFYECHAPREHVAVSAIPNGFQCYAMANGYMQCMTPPPEPAPPPPPPTGAPTPPRTNN